MLFTSFLEPLFNRKRFSGLDVLTGLMIIVGIFLIFHFEAGYTEGIISALLAALLACLFTFFNSWQVKRHDPVLLSFYEMTGRSEEHPSDLQSLMRISYAVLCLK